VPRVNCYGGRSLPDLGTPFRGSELHATHGDGVCARRLIALLRSKFALTLALGVVSLSYQVAAPFPSDDLIDVSTEPAALGPRRKPEPELP
jgi:hypothetical protein